MGGLRGVARHMQRTAVQAGRATFSKITGWRVYGSERRCDGTHPLRKHLFELRVGDSVVADPRQVTSAHIEPVDVTERDGSSVPKYDVLTPVAK